MTLTQKKGFTLIELMVVIAIIAVLAAVVTPQVFRQVARGRIASAEGFHNAMKTSATNYFGNLAAWPRTCGPGTPQPDCNTDAGPLVAGFTLGGFVTQGTNQNWDGPYIDRFPAAGSNPWRGNYRWYNNAGGTVFGAANGERYIYMSNLQPNDMQRIDVDKDGAAGIDTGTVQYGAGNAPCDAAGVLCILISRDGPVS